MQQSRRVFLVVIDALGVGAMADAPDYGDALTCNTLGHIDEQCPHLNLPTLQALGLGHLLPLRHVPPVTQPLGQVARLAEASKGKDTTTGHWEMMNIVTEVPFPTYPDGFPPQLVEAFIAQTGCGGVLGNKPASGTTILDELGPAHLQTGWPIVYTSADSVWQIATHVDKVPVPTLYQWCEAARALLVGPHEVSRVIARPFEGQVGAFKRLSAQRHDYAVPPPSPNTLEVLHQAGVTTVGMGKIKDIFCGAGLSHHVPTASNAQGLELLQAAVAGALPLAQYAINPHSVAALNPNAGAFYFINLVETDMNYGHRRDVLGYGQALEAVDEGLAALLPHLGADDLLLITADHGCDPTAPGSDHTREHVPLIAYSPAQPGDVLGTLHGFGHVGQRVAAWLQVAC